MKIISILILWVCMLIGCLDFNRRIEITSEYIVNDNWNKKGEKTGGNSIEIKKMKVKKDSTINPFSNLNQADILGKLEVDSSFIYAANVKINQGKKIYFNRDNGFYWWTDKGWHKTKILGDLQSNTWYEISRISYYYYVVYVDSTNKVHRFVINLSNY